MQAYLAYVAVLLLAAGCAPARPAGGQNKHNPLAQIIKDHAADFDSILARPDLYEVQIIYTQIDRDERQQPHFTTYGWNVDSNRYFYPASMVKMPLALLALEKINHLRRGGYPALTPNTPYRIDSVRAFQRSYVQDSTAPRFLPCIAHDIRRIFAVSDNQAYNHLFEFLGREYINQTLREKGYTHTGIVRRFFAGGRNNAYSSPITFLDQEGITRWKQGELLDTSAWVNPQTGLRKGLGYFNDREELVQEPFDFSIHNWFALTDMEKMLRSIIFPDVQPAGGRFDLTPRDYRFLWHCMGIFPRECDYPRYDTAVFHDGYVKYFLFGDTKARQDGSIRVFNKVGAAYGTLTDVAYVADFQNKVEFVLAATILCNSDRVFNDDRYDYQTAGFPFLAKLGRAVLDFERLRKRKVQPDLKPFADAVRTVE